MAVWRGTEMVVGEGCACMLSLMHSFSNPIPPEDPPPPTHTPEDTHFRYLHPTFLTVHDYSTSYACVLR